MTKFSSAILAAAVIGVSTLATAQGAGAVVVRHADFTFESGATFSGDITFTDDFSVVTAVDGLLNGYQDDILAYTGVGSTAISWLFLGGIDFNPDPNKVQTLLMNGTDLLDFEHFVSFAYDLSAAPAIVLAPGGLGLGFAINVNLRDKLVSGELSEILPEIPVPAPFILLLSGLAGLASLGMIRSKTSKV